MKRMAARRRVPQLTAILLFACLLLVGCREATAAMANSAKHAISSRGYAGVWRAADHTLLITQQGPAFVVQEHGPAGPKEVATLNGGVLHIGSATALYESDRDQLLFDGAEFQRISPEEQTRKDLALVGPAMAKFVAKGQYHMLPMNDFDYFHGVTEYEPNLARFDGWGTEYRYLHKNGSAHWAVVSAGPDGVFDPVMTAETVAQGMIRTNGDDVVLVDGTITTDAKPQALAADPPKPSFRYLGTFESAFSGADIYPVAQIALYRNGKTQLVGRMFYPPGLDGPHCRLDGNYDATTGKVVVRGTITVRDPGDSAHPQPYVTTTLYTFQGTWRPERLTGELAELVLGQAKQQPRKHAVTLNRRRDMDSYGETVTSLAQWERNE